MLGEIIIVFILFVLAPLAVFRGIKMLRDSTPGPDASKRSRRSASTEGGMRKSELEALIRDAVIDATAPLATRIDELERELLLGDGRLDPTTLSEAFGDDVSPEAADRRASGETERAPRLGDDYVDGTSLAEAFNADHESAPEVSRTSTRDRA